MKTTKKDKLREALSITADSFVSDKMDFVKGFLTME